MAAQTWGGEARRTNRRKGLPQELRRQVAAREKEIRDSPLPDGLWHHTAGPAQPNGEGAFLPTFFAKLTEVQPSRPVEARPLLTFLENPPNALL